MFNLSSKKLTNKIYMILEINNQEKNALIELINLAVKSGGLSVAEAGVILAKKIGDLKEEVKPVVKPEEKPVKK